MRGGRADTAVVLLWGMAVVAGCGGPLPQVPRENVRYAQALRTAANGGDPEGLETVARTIDRAARDGLIGPAEMAVYEEILALGRARKFADAEERCLAFLREQARR